MKALCPICRTEMVKRANILVCPRNDIGECCYDSLSIAQDELRTVVQQQIHHHDLRTYAVSEVK